MVINFQNFYIYKGRFVQFYIKNLYFIYILIIAVFDGGDKKIPRNFTIMAYPMILTIYFLGEISIVNINRRILYFLNSLTIIFLGLGLKENSLISLDEIHLSEIICFYAVVNFLIIFKFSAFKKETNTDQTEKTKIFDNNINYQNQNKNHERLEASSLDKSNVQFLQTNFEK